jgi:hypothetical protein
MNQAMEKLTATHVTEQQHNSATHYVPQVLSQLHQALMLTYTHIF